jgi:para-nitrobenzyl esterase
MKTEIINIPQGNILGTQKNNVRAWYGIPYAQPPVGKLRFRRAQPALEWDGTLAADKYASVCPQANKKYFTQNEDCLTLNIWSPAAGAEKKAVLFYIHGGSFYAGSGNEARYNGNKLAGREDVVVVTVNYRLGALGFLDFSCLDENFEANCGLSDVVLALKWVYENIGAFGGDKDKITVIGQSAGAIITSALLVMPAAIPYISKAIIMSGGPVWMHDKANAQKISGEFLKFMQINSSDELLSIPAEKLVAKQKRFIARCPQGEGTFSIEVDHDFVPEYPIPASLKGASRDVPVLIGNTKDELSFAFSKLLSPIMKVKNVVMAVITNEQKEIRKKIYSVYQKYGRKAKSALASDYVFKMTSLWLAQARNAFANTWMYRFDYSPLIARLTALRAIHSTDIPFLFGNFAAIPSVFMYIFSPAFFTIRRISRELQKDFTTFAKTGALNWRMCAGKNTPAKCYDKKCSVRPMIDPLIVARHEKSEFKKKCFAGVPINN